jgi:hypothetical protein
MGKINIRRTLNRASAVDINEGRVAYFRYRELMVAFSEKYSLPLERVVGAFAALSPNISYYGNLRSLVSVLEAFTKGLDRNKITVSSYRACKERAFTYLEGVSFLDTVKGKKTRAFYQNILYPLDPAPVTIDGHAVNIWKNQVKNLKHIGKWKYETVAADYRAIAKQEGILPHQLQAITWFTWKRINNIYYSPPQLHLWQDREGDLWRTLWDVEDIKPY